MLKLLVPVSQSTRSLQAVRHAAFLYNERCASEIVLVNVQPPLESTRLEAFYPLSKLRALEDAYAEAALSRAKRILEDAGVKYSVEVRVGPLAPTIANCAEQNDCDEIVVAAPRKDLFHAVARLVNRSVLDRLVSISRVPVTAVN
ncbi:universal stress protein [Paraburkholderia phenazinium]|jgi:nucleotide-binding universal stress UspA family protein|uniref:Nucleotide-binding universal stress protein, UspA family n=1 Tax=Paraburkholderia phenazinium TaxID=60549 RepID=A0A1G8G9W0_9BURK|nr:universal stress protein [Paraburkholderia phenazinium]SDH91153.1 Nucleotide-binding universal stress protein, UspA family [Paraburkholderia phenazinium]